MCGIAGIVSRDGALAPSDTLDELERALFRRGPDRAGRYQGRGVAFVHRRLSIIDLQCGGQPFFSPSGQALVANAEIYNHVELRHGLLSQVEFHTSSDCEVILPLYNKLGKEFLQALRGMYAFAIHDPGEDLVILARDPFGIKPLYYTESPGCFAFASEAGALVQAKLVRPDVSADRANELLHLTFTTGGETIFSAIRRVLPGELLVIRSGRVTERHRFSGLPTDGPGRISEAEALSRLDESLGDSVGVHQRSDVPYGLFLSGGIDSRSILACMARNGTSRVKAYTACFPDSVRDEGPAAAKAAGLFGAEHIPVEVRAADFWSALPAIVDCADDPVIDAAMVPTYLLAREAAKDVKVVLCGEGGDEIFAGYSRYRRQARPLWLLGRKRRRTSPFTQTRVLRRQASNWRAGIVSAERDSRTRARTRLQVAQALDCADFLAHGLLTKIDRSLMANSVEGRIPFLDPVVAGFGFRLPDRLKLRHGRGKYLLRKWLETQAPQDDCFAKKRGFTPPFLAWVRQEGERLGPLVASDAAIAEICHPDEVVKLFQSDDKQSLDAAWRLLFYALWHRRHVRGAKMEAGPWSASPRDRFETEDAHLPRSGA